MSNATRAATDDWNREVDVETANLIRGGTPPWQAAGEAQRIVADRRRYARRLDDKDKAEALAAILGQKA